jgi:D-lyxose ketol-isomerase
MNTYMDEGIISKQWGYEKILVNCVEYCGKILLLLPNGKASSVHYHRKKKETFHVLEGYVEIEVWSCTDKYGSNDLGHWGRTTRATLAPGMSLTLDPLVGHRFWAKREIAKIIEFSMFDEPNDTYRLIDAGNAPTEVT